MYRMNKPATIGEFQEKSFQGIHFGTSKAANERIIGNEKQTSYGRKIAKSSHNLMPVFLNIRNIKT